MSAVQEDEGTKEAKNQQLLAEDIDSILARAEVGHPCPHVLRLTPVPATGYFADPSSYVRNSPWASDHRLTDFPKDVLYTCLVAT